MVNKVQSQPQQQLQGLKVGGNLKINGPTMKTSNIAKIVFAIAAVAAAVVFTATAILTANPLFFIGTAIALGVLLGVCGAHVHATVGYRRPLFVDPYHRRPPVFVPPPVVGRPRSPVFVPAPRPAPFGGPAHGRPAVVPMRGPAGAFHVPVNRR